MLLHFRKQPYKPKKKQALIPNLERDLKHGWLLTILAQIDRCLWGRWDYWALCQAIPAHAWMRWKMEPGFVSSYSRSCLDAVENGANVSYYGA